MEYGGCSTSPPGRTSLEPEKRSFLSLGGIWDGCEHSEQQQCCVGARPRVRPSEPHQAPERGVFDQLTRWPPFFGNAQKTELFAFECKVFDQVSWSNTHVP